MMESIVSGSRETLLIDVTDRLHALSDLAGIGLVYDIKDKNGTIKVSNSPAANVGMTAECLVDTTIGGNWTPGRYFLYLKFSAGADSPILGPMEFKVI